MQIDTFRDLYIAELQELASAEREFAASVRRIAQMASHLRLKNALIRHCEEAEIQRQNVESILRRHNASPDAHTDQAMQALVREGDKMLTILQGGAVRDAGLVASIQKLLHYRMAAYGTAAALAGQLDLRDEQDILHQSLEREKKADKLLTMLAKSEVNRDALAA
jgi:ferritin-like metal-binding protein YciE